MQLNPKCSECGKYNDNLVLGDNRINGVKCIHCGQELSEDDCFI